MKKIIMLFLIVALFMVFSAASAPTKYKYERRGSDGSISYIYTNEDMGKGFYIPPFGYVFVETVNK